MFTDQGERPLLQPKLGAFFYADLGTLRMPAERGENGDVGIDPQRIVAPVPGCDHPAVEVEDPTEFLAIKGCDWAPVPGRRERRNDAQALFALG